MTSGDIMQAYISALFLNILFEAPILGLEKILLRRKIQVKGLADPVQFTASQDPNCASFLGIPRAHFCNVISGQRVADSTSFQANSQY
ncbi:hypothetical protein B566_EDAN002611 [Ephemera danica]|nr:hypothetical protein B566_EDAN002611 [Ephemera danica]